MANFILPIIRESEYDAFHREVGANLADSYHVWRKVIDESLDEARKAGDNIIAIQIKHDEFIAYCRATRQERNPQILLSFVEKIRRERK